MPTSIDAFGSTTSSPNIDFLEVECDPPFPLADFDSNSTDPSVSIVDISDYGSRVPSEATDPLIALDPTFSTSKEAVSSMDPLANESTSFNDGAGSIDAPGCESSSIHEAVDSVVVSGRESSSICGVAGPPATSDTESAIPSLPIKKRRVGKSRSKKITASRSCQFSCAECDVTFVRLLHYSDHVRYHHQHLVYRCQCGKDYQTHSGIQRHLNGSYTCTLFESVEISDSSNLS